MAKETEAKASKKPRELVQPKSKKDITVDFVNKFFSYQIRLADYEYKQNKTEDNKAKLEAKKKAHKDWIDFVVDTYDGKETKAKTAKILKAFADKYYPKLPKNPPVVKGQFK